MRPATGAWTRRHLLAVTIAGLAFAGSARGVRPASATATDDPAWAALRAGGTVAMLRHARAPGTGDPPDFRVADCATQRNLSDEGRAQARRIGDAFRSHDVRVTRVLSSGWCRCLDTARLAFGDAERAEPLDSFFADRSTAARQTAETRALVAAWRGPGVLALVTHQVNVTALTGIVPRDGEVVVLRPDGSEGGFTAVGRLTP